MVLNVVAGMAAADTGTGDEFEAWLAEADCAGPGLSVLADADDSIEFELAVAESDAVPLSTDVAARGDDASAPAAGDVAAAPSMAVVAESDALLGDALQAAHGAAVAEADELARARAEVQSLRAQLAGARLAVAARASPSACASVPSRAAGTNPALRPSAAPVTPRGGGVLTALAEGGVLTTVPAAPTPPTVTVPTPTPVTPGPVAPSPGIDLGTPRRAATGTPTALEHLASAVILSERALAKARKKANSTWVALATSGVKTAGRRSSERSGRSPHGSARNFLSRSVRGFELA